MDKMILLLIICPSLEPAIGQGAHCIGEFAKTDTLELERPVPFTEQGAFQDFLQAHLQYPRLALENCIEGEVILLLRFSEQGRVEFAEIVKGIGFGCDEEAHRLAMMLSAPAAGMPVTSNLKLVIRFRLQ